MYCRIHATQAEIFLNTSSISAMLPSLFRYFSLCSQIDYDKFQIRWLPKRELQDIKVGPNEFKCSTLCPSSGFLLSNKF